MTHVQTGQSSSLRNGRTSDGRPYFRGELRTRESGGREVPVLEWPKGSPVEVLREAERVVSAENRIIREAQAADLPLREREKVIREARQRRKEAQQRLLRVLRGREAD